MKMKWIGKSSAVLAFTCLLPYGFQGLYVARAKDNEKVTERSNERSTEKSKDPKGNTQMKTEKKYEKPSLETIKKVLTPEQFEVTQKEGTERPFKNQYWDHHDAGIYVDIVTGEPLFSSRDKFDSGTGWPSFTKPIEKEYIVERTERGVASFILGERTEVRSKNGDSHLGHVFSDGPQQKGGLRYCINSAALKFIPANKLKEMGYEKYAKDF